MYDLRSKTGGDASHIKLERALLVANKVVKPGTIP